MKLNKKIFIFILLLLGLFILFIISYSFYWNGYEEGKHDEWCENYCFDRYTDRYGLCVEKCDAFPIKGNIFRFHAEEELI